MSDTQTTTIVNGLTEKLSIEWIRIPDLPVKNNSPWQQGYAGPVAGAHNEYLMVAGGSNFLDNPPWKGGKKLYHDTIFLLKHEDGREMKWSICPDKLPFPLAYSACISFPGGIVSIGGEDQDGPVSSVFHFGITGGRLKTKQWPDLPEALTSPSATLLENTLYVAGGVTEKGASSTFLSLNIDNPESGWKNLPALPVPLSHSLLTALWDGSETCIYLTGGRNKTSEIHTFFPAIRKYSPAAGKWVQAGNINLNEQPYPLSAGTGVKYRQNHMLIIGGDPGIFFNQTEKINNQLSEPIPEKTRENLLEEKEKLLGNHPGFSPFILDYDTFTGKCEKICNIAGDSPVTTTVFKWHDMVIIPSGETRPGRRTPQVLAFRIHENKIY
jgi:N-acetylneuraminic acid mutarotase